MKYTNTCNSMFKKSSALEAEMNAAFFCSSNVISKATKE